MFLPSLFRLSDSLYHSSYKRKRTLRYLSFGGTQSLLGTLSDERDKEEHSSRQFSKFEKKDSQRLEEIGRLIFGFLICYEFAIRISTAAVKKSSFG